MPQGIGGNCGAMAGSEAAPTGASPIHSYRSQCRQCGQVATAIPVPTDTISSKATIKEMRTRRIAEMGHPPVSNALRPAPRALTTIINR